MKNPDETWTKEKILQHIEDTMCELEDNNEIDLLHNFFKTLSTDKHISKTLMKCGEDFVAMLFSFQQRHKARNISMSEGSLCVTFCFVNDLNLETFMQKLADNDGQLKKDFSRLILNKTLLKIFNIDPQLVWWTASTAKIYRGYVIYVSFSFNIYTCTDNNWKGKVFELITMYYCIILYRTSMLKNSL